jgi:endoglucanase Acf2
MATSTSQAQSVVPLGSGSYSSTTPAANETEDSYYALPQNQVEEFYNYLKVDPAKANLPMPTNHWWTDLLIGSRSYLPSTPPGNTQYVLGQDLYGGNIWFIPGKVDPESYGLNISYPNTWKAPNANGSPQGTIDAGTNFVIKGNTPYSIPAGDTLIADFESGFPAGTTQSGVVNGGFIIDGGSGLGGVGVMGASLANTRGNNGTQGIVRLPDFTINKTYLNFLLAGGNFADTQVRVILSNGTTVATAQGLSSTNLRWVALDLTAWQGQTAHVELVDQNTGAWGFLSVDQIVLSNSNNMVGRFGGDYIADETVVQNWSDWSVDFDMPNAASGRNIQVTLTRGVPFTWTRWTNMKPRLTVGASPVFYDAAGAPITVTGGTFTATSFAVVVGGKNYGIYLPDNTVCNVGGTGATTYVEPQISGANNYLVVGYLPAISNLSEFGTYAYARPTNTQITWTNDPQNGRVITNWTITTTAMKGSNLQTLQGWIPHHYRTTTTNFPFKSYTYQTQRGIMKMASGNSFQINFPFAGIAPVLPAPSPKGLNNDFQPARMQNYLNNFNPGAMISDTYNSGKALLTCAQYMMIADQMGDTTNFNRFKSALTTALTNWFTYTPGEANGFFSSYPEWKGTVGFNASYGSQAFNDLHFHYGYFAGATAFLGKYDPTFLTNYGPMIRLVTKSFANFDRADMTNPFMRTFDVWEGHGNAGGFSSGNGVNQESSSEAMNSWVGVYMLGSMLNDSSMSACGAMGFAMEGAATNEYWQDLYKTNFPASFDVAGAAMVWSDNFTYATYFDADPAWVYGIQYVPATHWNNYMVRDQKATVAQKYAAIWTERQDYMNSRPAWSAATAYDINTYVNFNGHVWYNSVALAAGQPAPGTAGASWVDTGTFVGNTPDILGAYLGGYYIGYQMLWDTENTVVQFDNFFAAGKDIATNNGGAGNLYYEMHALRLLGEQDTTYSTSVPGAVYYNATTNTRTAVVYNPGASTATVNIYKNGASVQTLSVPGRSQGSAYVGNTPVITSSWNAAGMVSSPSQFAYSITATNSPTSYSITGTLPAGLSLNTGTGVISGTPTTAGTSTVTMKATNANGTGSATLVITIYPFTNPPVVSSPSTAPGTVGAAFSYQIVGSNSPTGYGVTGTLPAGLSVNASTGLISGTPATGSAGVYNVTVRASNVAGTGTSPLAITILENLALNLTGVSASSVTVGQEANKANDGNTTSTRWTASGGAFPQWWQVDLGASKNIQRVDIAWFSAASRAYKYKIEAGTDGTNFPTLLKDNTANTTFGNTSDSFTSISVRYVKVTVTGSTAGFASAYEIAVLGMPAQPAPVINSPLTANGSVGTPFSYQITATNNPTSFNATGLPAGLTVNTSTGLISGTPSASFSGNVTLTASNAGGPGTAQLALTVIQPIPVITSSGTWNVVVGVSDTYQITATNNPTSFSVTGLPAGFSVNTTTGLITGSPLSVGTTNVTLGATNSGGTGQKTLTIIVSQPAPVITSPTSATGSVGASFAYQITATNSPTSYGVTGTLPAGVTLNTSTGLISGTPSATFSGNVTITASNATGPGSATLAISIISDTNQALNKTVTVSSFQVGNEPAKGNDGSGTTRWAAANGTFPAWWSVDLGASKVLSKVDIDWLNPTSRSYKYKIEGGTDGVNFPTLIKDNTANTVIGNTSDPTTATVRYVKITVTGSSSGGFASFFEAKVFGH